MEKKFFKPGRFSAFIIFCLATVAFIVLWVHSSRTCFEWECMTVLVYATATFISAAFAIALGAWYFSSKREFKQIQSYSSTK